MPKDLNWREPIAFNRLGPSFHFTWQVATLKFLGLVALVPILRAIVPAPNAPDWPLMMLIAVAGGFAVAYVLPRLAVFAPQLIIISNKGINRNGASPSGIALHTSFVAWDMIQRCEIQPITIAGRHYRALFIYGKEASAPPLIIGLSDTVTDDDVRTAIASKGVVML